MEFIVGAFIGRLFACALYGPIEGFGDWIAHSLLGLLYYFGPPLFLVSMVFFFCFFLYIIIPPISAAPDREEKPSSKFVKPS